jgi:hypothetical protein
VLCLWIPGSSPSRPRFARTVGDAPE